MTMASCTDNLYPMASGKPPRREEMENIIELIVDRQRPTEVAVCL